MIDNKYLPIGTICNIKGNNRKVMITGYYSVEYYDKVRMYDYSGCVYPEGILLKNGCCSFNHNDILNVEFYGYKAIEFQQLNGQLKCQNTVKHIHSSQNMFSNIKFDENGVVIFESRVESDTANNKRSINSSKLTEDNIEIPNPFINSNFFENERIEQNKNADTWPIFSNIRFDENGTVISSDVEFKDKEE